MSPKAFTREEQQRLGEAESYLINHLHQTITISQLARHAAMGEERFKDGFRLQFGYTPISYLKEARMQTAMVLLKHSDKPIKEIASLCGYQHYKNFLTGFKRFYGVTANSVRR